MKILLSFLIIIQISAPPSHAGLWEMLGLKRSNTQSTPTLASLSEDQVASGLKEALEIGLKTAVKRIGHEGGFLTNAAVRIPLPENLKPIESTLRALNQGHLADNFVVALNRAAEQAVPEATSIFADAIRKMSLQDAKGILTGGREAATEYFRVATATNLHQKFRPIVEQATKSSGATAAYKQLLDKVSANKWIGALKLPSVNAHSFDVDTYVTHKATDALFLIVAEEEKKIRENPAARTTKLLEQVFGAVSREPDQRR